MLILASLLLAGCSADDYRASADRQVQALIKERQERATGYTPEVQIAPTTQPILPKRAYASVPMTRSPETDDAPVQWEVFELPYAPFGPPVPQENDLPDVEQDIYEATSRLQVERIFMGPTLDMSDKLQLDLFSAVKYAVENSRTYRTEMEDLYLAGLDVTLQRHLFTPRPYATTTARYRGGQKDVDYDSAFSVTQRAGIRQQPPYGGEVAPAGLV